MTRRTILRAAAAMPFVAVVFRAAAREQTWTVRTLAGTGKPGYSGDGGPAAAAQLNQPFGVAVGPDGATYVCDTNNHCVRRIDRDGVIRTVAGTGKPGYAGDGGPATAALLNEPYEVRFDGNGDLYVVEMRNHLVRRVGRVTGAISTFAGTGRPGFAGDGGPAPRAQFNQPHAIQFDPDGRFLYVCDIGNHRLRRIETATGVVTTFAGDGTPRRTPDQAVTDEGPVPLNSPRALDFTADGDLWLTLRDDSRTGTFVYRFDMKARMIDHVPGPDGFARAGGGRDRTTRLSSPKGISVGPDGNVYLADTEGQGVRMIDMKRATLERIAGTGEKGDGPDGDAAACRLARPHGIFVRPDGAVLVGDTENHRVREIRPAGG